MNHIFADLNILHDPNDQKWTMELVKLAVQLGYDVVAVNIDVGNINISNLEEDSAGAMSSGKGKKRKKQQEKLKGIPTPFKVDNRHLDFSTREACGKAQFRQYSRITLTLEDPDAVHYVLKHPTIQEYDLVAVYPKTESMFTTIINKTEIDMICVNMTERPVWASKGRLVQMAIEKGLTFEITYAAALSDSSERRDSFCNGRELVRACGRSKDGIIFSSRARKPIELRSPFDVANMTLLYGITNTEDGRRAVGVNAKRLLLRAETKRKTVKGAMAVEDVEHVAGPGVLAKLAKIPEFRVEIEQVPAEESNVEESKGVKRKGREEDTN